MTIAEQVQEALAPEPTPKPTKKIHSHVRKCLRCGNIFIYNDSSPTYWCHECEDPTI